MARKKCTIHIGGNRWKLRRCRVPSDRYGDCCHDSRTIRISQSLHGEELLNVLLHELIHARWPDLSEDAVLEFADELAGVVHAEGFRQPDDHEE
jgi:hypothetical protein